MKKSNNALNILVTKEIKGIGKAWIVKNIKGNESVEEIVSLLNHKLKKEITVDFFESRKAQISQELDRFEEIYDGLVAIGDRNFPKYRGDVKESERPIYLFYKGDLSLLDEENKCVTVIGLLNPEENIIERKKNSSRVSKKRYNHC